MAIALVAYEREAIAAAAKLFQLDSDLTIAAAGTLTDLRDLFDNLTAQTDVEYRQGRIALAGLTNHTHHLFVGGLQSLLVGNAHVWSACLRGLIETFGACVMIGKSPATAPNFLGSTIKAGKLRAAAAQAQPGMGADLDRLNSIVHPASGAIHAGFTVVDRDNRIARFQYGYRVPSPSEGQEAVAALANTTILIAERLGQLATNGSVLNAGKVIMERAREHDARGDV